MNSYAPKFILIVAISIADICAADHRNSTNSVANDEPDRNSRYESSLCPHKDYRSYVKCLQNRRRHDHLPQATSRGTPSAGVNCVDECERESCRHSVVGPCADFCYDRCLKKTKEIHHRITEYETTCGEGEDCNNSGNSDIPAGLPAVTNLTTSIDIRNYVNNTNVIVHNPKAGEGDGDRDRDHRDRNATCRSGQPGCGDAGVEEGSRRSEPPRGLPPGFQPWYPGPSLTLIPQIQMVPQLTFGLGISPGLGFGSIGGGCAYTSIWLCLPQQQQQQQQQQSQQGRDCSGCVQPYPYSRGRCDPSC